MLDLLLCVSFESYEMEEQDLIVPNLKFSFYLIENYCSRSSDMNSVTIGYCWWTFFKLEKADHTNLIKPFHLTLYSQKKYLHFALSGYSIRNANTSLGSSSISLLTCLLWCLFMWLFSHCVFCSWWGDWRKTTLDAHALLLYRWFWLLTCMWCGAATLNMETNVPFP